MDDGFDDVNDMVDFDQEEYESGSVSSTILTPPKLISSDVQYGHHRWIVLSIWATLTLIFFFGIIASRDVGSIIVSLLITMYCAMMTIHYWDKYTPSYRIEKYEIQHWPCPRCAAHDVAIYSTSYFTCGFCGARGRYPFPSEQDRALRLGAARPVSVVTVKKNI